MGTLGQGITAEMQSLLEWTPASHVSGSTNWTLNSANFRSGAYSIRKISRPKHGGVTNPSDEVIVNAAVKTNGLLGDFWPISGWREDPGSPGDWAICCGLFWDKGNNEFQIWADDTGPWSGSANLTEQASVSTFQTTIHRMRVWTNFGFYLEKTTPTITAYLDGIQILTWTGGVGDWLESPDIWDFWSAGLISSSGTNETFIDDFYVENVSTEGDQIPLSRRYFMALSDGAGSSAQWTPDAGNNWERVDETTVPDGDTSYVESETAADKDLYTFVDLVTADISANYDVDQVFMQSEYKTVDDSEGASSDYDHVVSDGGSESTDGPFSNATLDTWDIAWSVFALQPDASAWNLADFNSWTYGMEIN